MNASAKQASLELLIRRQAGNIHGIDAIAERNRARHQPAVVSPVEADPGSALPWLILHMGRGVEGLIVVNAEYSRAALSGWCGTDPAQLRLKKSRGHAGHHHQRAEAM